MLEFIILIIFVCFLIFLFVRFIEGQKREAVDEVKKEFANYYLRPSMMDKREKTFFDILKKELGLNYHIFPKMRVEDFVGVDRRGIQKNEHYGLRSRIKSRHVDFVVCDLSMKPVMAIELDGSSHNTKSAMKSDTFKNYLSEAIGLPLRRVRVGSDFASQVV